MSIETLILGVINLGFTAAAFFVGRQTAAKNDGIAQGKESTGFSKDIEYIRESVKEIKESFSVKTNALDGRQTELSNQLLGVASVAQEALLSSKSAHKRLNEHVRVEHGKEVHDWRENVDEG